MQFLEMFKSLLTFEIVAGFKAMYLLFAIIGIALIALILSVFLVSDKDKNQRTAKHIVQARRKKKPATANAEPAAEAEQTTAEKSDVLEISDSMFDLSIDELFPDDTANNSAEEAAQNSTSAKTEEITASEAAEDEPVNEEIVASDEEPAEDNVEETASVYKDEVAETVEPEPVAEEDAEPIALVADEVEKADETEEVAPIEEAAKEDVKVSEPVVEKAPKKAARTKTTTAKSAPKEAKESKTTAKTTAKTAAKAEEEKPVAKPKLQVAPKKEKVDKSKNQPLKLGMNGKFEISTDGEVFYFSLFASNGQMLYDSRPYANEKSCRAAIQTFKQNVLNNPLDVRRDKTGNHRWFYVNGPTYFMGIAYRSYDSAERNAQSVKKFAQTAIIVKKVD